MTVDERVETLMSTLPYLHKSEGGVKGFRNRLNLALLKVACDQRHACAEALMETYRANKHGLVGGDTAIQAVMNAPLAQTQDTNTPKAAQPSPQRFQGSCLHELKKDLK